MPDETMTAYHAERLPDVDSPAQLAAAFAGTTRPNFTQDYDKDSQVHDNGVRALRAGDGLITYAHAIPIRRRPSRSSGTSSVIYTT